MIKRLLFFILVSIVLINSIYSQNDSSSTLEILTLEIPLHNSLVYNRFLFNPTFSLVQESKSSLSAYNRNPRATFNDNSQIYFLSYSRKLQKKMGLGINLFQQNLGVIRFIGATGNFAYMAELDKKMDLTFGLNLKLSKSTLKNYIDLAQINDEAITNFNENSTVTIEPGINYRFKRFDLGISVKNLVAYDITGKALLTDGFEYQAHLMYTAELGRRTNNKIRGMIYGLKPNFNTIIYGGNLIFEISENWLQSGYNSFYGASLGIGITLNKVASIGYTIEPGIGGSGNAAEFGSTHEVALAYNFAKLKGKSKRKSTSKLSKTNSEVDKLKKELLKQHKLNEELKNGIKKQKLSKLKPLNKDSINDSPIAITTKELDPIRRQIQQQKTNDSLLNSAVSITKRDFNSLLKSLVKMNNVAKKIKKSGKLPSTKTLNQDDKFIQFATKKRKPPKYATKFIRGYKEGFYLIGNVFKGGIYAGKFNEKLKALGFANSQVILNSNNKYEYVTIDYYANKKDAEENYYNNINDTYFGEMWILHIAKKKVKSVKKIKKEETMSSQEPVELDDEEFVTVEKLSDIEGHTIENGYYLIRKIIKDKDVFDQEMSKLKAKGVESKFFKNPKNNEFYIYMGKYDNLEAAKKNQLIKIVDNNGDIFILKIK